MRDRKGIILLMFDLQAVTTDDRREYSHFKKDLRKEGFLPLQESCYLKLIRNYETVDLQVQSLRKVMPAKGNVSVLPMNLAEFKGMRCLLGESFNMSLFTDDVYCVGDEETDA